MGELSRSIRAGFAWPLSQGRKVEVSQSVSQPLPWAVGVGGREEKCERRRSWFWVAMVLEMLRGSVGGVAVFVGRLGGFNGRV